jgi:hypothetical protein
MVDAGDTPGSTFVPDQFAMIFRTNQGWGKETVEAACRAFLAGTW